MKFKVRTIEYNENTYVRKEDVADLLREFAGGLATDDRTALEELAQNIRNLSVD